MEDRRRKEEKDSRRDECRKQNQNQSRKDDSLLGTYQSEADLTAARTHALANENALIDLQHQATEVRLQAPRR
jgi:hypothetical protein